MSLEECYQLLKLPVGAPLEEVKKSWKRLAIVWHPDRYTEMPNIREFAQEQLKSINFAYETIRTHHRDATEAATTEPTAASKTSTSPSSRQERSSPTGRAYTEDGTRRQETGGQRKSSDADSRAYWKEVVFSDDPLVPRPSAGAVFAVVMLWVLGVISGAVALGLSWKVADTHAASGSASTQQVVDASNGSRETTGHSPTDDDLSELPPESKPTGRLRQNPLKGDFGSTEIGRPRTRLDSTPDDDSVAEDDSVSANLATRTPRDAGPESTRAMEPTNELDATDPSVDSERQFEESWQVPVAYSPYMQVSFFARGGQVVGIDRESVSFFNGRTGETQQVRPRKLVQEAKAVASNGKEIAVLCPDGIELVGRSGRSQALLHNGLDARSMQFSWNGNRLFCLRSKTVAVIDTSTGHAEIEVAHARTSAAACSGDNRTLVTVSGDGTVAWWNLRDGDLIEEHVLPDLTSGGRNALIQVSQRATEVYVAGSDHLSDGDAIRVFDLESRSLAKRFSTGSSKSDKFTLATNGDMAVLIGHRSGGYSLTVIDVAEGEAISTVVEDVYIIPAFAISADGRRVAAVVGEPDRLSNGTVYTLRLWTLVDASAGDDTWADE